MVNGNQSVPPSSRDVTEHCIRHLGNHSLLSPQQEAILSRVVIAWRRAIAPTHLSLDTKVDEAPEPYREIILQGHYARSKLVTHNMKFAVHMAKKFQGLGREMVDLINDGVLGLDKAAIRFDASKGRFTTHAYLWVKQAILRELNKNNRTIRLPEQIAEELNKIKKYDRTFVAKMGRSPWLEEIATELKVPLERVELLMEWSRPIESLDTTTDGNEDTRLSLVANGDREALDVMAMNEVWREAISQIQGTLSEQEWLVLSRRHGVETDHSHTYKELAQQLGVSIAKIQRIEGRAIAQVLSNISSSMISPDEMRGHPRIFK